MPKHPESKAAAVEHPENAPLMPAPDTLGSYHNHAVLAQPPARLLDLQLSEPERISAGVTAVLQSVEFSWGQDGVGRGTRALTKLNQFDGYDCTSCAWPDPDVHRSIAEFCESGAKAVASDADTRECNPEVFAQHSLSDLSRLTDRDLNNLGRLTHPMVKRPGGTYYEPIEWRAAFDLVAQQLNSLASPDEAIFYTSGKVPNEPAFLFGLFARQYGTNNLPDCSNMCHESTTSSLTEKLGLGKASVTLNDFYEAEVIIIIGQNPGTNSPRMLTALEKAKKNGAKIISVNPQFETGLNHFREPQDFKNPLKAVPTLLTSGTKITDVFLQVRLGGDIAVLRGLMKHLFEAEEFNPGQVIDHAFIAEHTDCYDSFAASLRNTSWEEIEASSGLSCTQLLEAANLIGPKQKIMTLWGMGVTQQKRGTDVVKEIVNLHLLKGAIGKPGAGVCPVRGHSNVQGDRTMGIWEKMGDEFLDALGNEFDFEPPRAHGLDVVKSLRAIVEGKTKVFFSLGGNLLAAGPDTELIADGMRRQQFTAFVATKLNRGHLTTGETSLLLPTLAHVDIDRQKSGHQMTSCESTTGVIGQNKGVLEPLSSQMLSEVAIISGIAIATLGSRLKGDWVAMTESYDVIRDHISRVVPGFDEFNRKLREPGGFYLPNGPRRRKFATESQKAQFSVTKLELDQLEPDQLVLASIRAHDQFNTTVYEYNDRYRGVKGERRVLFMNAQDAAVRGLKERDRVNITSHYKGQTRTVENFLIVPYDLPRGNVTAYYPEMNALVPLSSVVPVSNTPTFKHVVVTVAKAQATPAASAMELAAVPA